MSKLAEPAKQPDSEPRASTARGPANLIVMDSLGPPRGAGGNLAIQRAMRSLGGGDGLPISQPGDASEREAEQAAARPVGDSPVSNSPRSSLPPPSTSAVTWDGIPEEARDAIEAGGPGQTIPQPTRALLESSFSTDLAVVRVHTGPTADRGVRALNARAFTFRNGIWLASSESVHDISLMTHEVTHVIQQARGLISISRSCDVPPPQPSAPPQAEPTETEPPPSPEIEPRRPPTMIRPYRPSPPEGQDRPVITPPPSPTVVPSPTAPPPVPAPASGPSSAIEIVFPTQTLIDPGEDSETLYETEPACYEFFLIPIELPPPLFLMTVGLRACIGLKVEAFYRYGPGVLRDIRVALDPAASRYSGTAQFYMPFDVGPRLVVTGSLIASADWPFPGVLELLAIEGNLRATGAGHILAAAAAGVRVMYDNGQWTFSARPHLDFASALTFDLDAGVEARVLEEIVWSKKWRLYHWQWGRAVRFGNVLSIDRGPQGWGFRNEPFAERISADELLDAFREPAEDGSIVIIPSGRQPLPERLQEFEEAGADPQTVLFALADATDSEREALLADSGRLGSVSSRIGEQLWPTALRILRRQPSETVPALDEATVHLADRHIRLGRFPDALHVVVSRLQEQGVIDSAIARFEYVRETTPGSEGVTFDADTRVDPRTGRRYTIGPNEIHIHDPAFVHVPWLYSTVLHEYLHAIQFHYGTTAAEEADPDYEYWPDVESYLWEIEHARSSGLLVSPRQMRELGDRLTSNFNRLSDSPQHGKPRYQARYDEAMRRVADATSGRLPVNLAYTISDARAIVQRSSQQIAELVRQRPEVPHRAPDDERRRIEAEQRRIDGEIERIQRERNEALVEVVLSDNPLVEIVDRTRGIYRYSVRDGETVRYVYGAINVVWNLGPISRSAFEIGPQIISPPPGPQDVSRMGIGGTAIQGRVQPFPGDIDFVEELDIYAADAASAGRSAARAIIDMAVRASDSTEFELLRMTIFTGDGRRLWWSADQLVRADRNPRQVSRLAEQLTHVQGGNINTFWRAWIEDSGGRRFIDFTKLINLHAMSSSTGDTLFATLTYSEYQVAYMEEPPRIPHSALGAYAAALRTAALGEFRDGNFLKAGKRAFNYFMAIGNIEGMQALEPVFRGSQARVNQQVAAIEAIARALMHDRPSRPGRAPERWQSRILLATEAAQQLRNAADVIEQVLPPVPGQRTPAEIAADLRTAAGNLRGDANGILLPEVSLQRDVEKLQKETKKVVNEGVRPAIEEVFRRYMNP